MCFKCFCFPTACHTYIAPDKVESVDLSRGHWGTLGSIITWNYIQGGEKKFNKTVIEAVDEKKKSITFKSIEGNMLESYNPFLVKVDVHTNGEENLITWTFEYEKKTQATPEPRAFMDFLVGFAKQIGTKPQHLAN